MARWGNALGGWKKQRRNAKGQFTSGTTGAASRAASRARKKVSSKSRSRTKSKKSPANKPTRKRLTKTQKAAIGAGVVVGAGALAYGSQLRSANKEFKVGGALSTQHMAGGISVTTTKELKRHYVRVDPVAVDALYNAQTVPQVLKAGSQIWKPSLRPQVHSTHYIHSGDELLGYATDVVKGRRLHAENLYLKPSARGNRRVVAGLSQNMKARHAAQIDAGRKIVISKYRSEDSERIVRNQARKLGKNKVIVQKRFDPGSKFTSEITKSMDSFFEHTQKDRFSKVRSAKAGVII